MKIMTFLTGLVVPTLLTYYANAEVVRGSANGVYTHVFAVDANATKRLPDFDSKCVRKYWLSINTKFHVKYKVNTDEPNAPQFAALQYKELEAQLTGSQQENGRYLFSSTDELPYRFDNYGVNRIILTMNENLWDVKSQLVLYGGEAKSDDCWHPLTCSKHKYTFYQCVLSTR